VKLLKSYFVYMLTNKPRGVLYVGVTNDLERRVYEHRHGKGSAFCKKYNLDKLVYAAEFADVNEAIAAEKRIKKWRRAWKEKIIEEINPDWQELMPMLGEFPAE
jgi:putative endonuclease